MKCSRTQNAQTQDVGFSPRLLILFVLSNAIFTLAACQPIEGPPRANDLQVSQSLEEGQGEPDLIRLLQLPLTPIPSLQDLIQIVREECRTREAAPPETEVILSPGLDTDRCRLTDEEESTPLRAAGSVEIRVFVHIIMSGDGTMGDVANSVIEEQIEVLNEAFAGVHPRGVPTPFRFVLVETERIQNEEWFNMTYSEHEPTQAEVAAKAAHNEGERSTLNLYTANVTEPHGWARFPWEDSNVDGVVVGFSYLPNGTNSDYNEGDVATHEVGHWLGLFHTYEGGCAPPGDCVDDTDAEDRATLFCPNAVPDSCPTVGFSDEIDNYMNYTWDSCMIRFTAGQARRMDAIHRKFRT